MAHSEVFTEYPIDPSEIIEWPMTIAKATKNELILRDHGGHEVKVTSNAGELIFKRIW